jgi:hypothetical protein
VLLDFVERRWRLAQPRSRQPRDDLDEWTARQHRDDVVRQDLAGESLTRAALHCEWKNGHRRAQRARVVRQGTSFRRGAPRCHAECVHRLLQVLQVARTQVFERELPFRRQPLLQCTGNDDLSRPGQRSDAGGQVDVGAVDIVSVGDELRQMGPHAQVHVVGRRKLAVHMVEPVPHRDSRS